MKRVGAEIEGAEAAGYIMARGVSRKEIAAHMEVHPSLLSKIFTGEVVPGYCWLIRLGEALEQLRNTRDRLVSA